MRFRTGLIIGLGVGYYYGAKAGNERYEQIERYLGKLRSTGAYQEVVGRVTGLVDESITRTRELVEEAAFGGSSPRSTEASEGYDHRGDPTFN